jgi:hypothetical protein
MRKSALSRIKFKPWFKLIKSQKLEFMRWVKSEEVSIIKRKT